MSDHDNIKTALSYIDPHDRDTWFRMGAAIKDELGENGFEMWDNWSRSSDNYKESDAKAVWKSIKTGHIHIATLFKTARENGYRPDKPYTPPSTEELAKRAQEALEKQRVEAERSAKAHAKAAKAHAKAAKTAYGIWKNAQSADPDHAYARSKGLGLTEAAMRAIRQNEYKGKKQLVIPLYSDKKLVNVQTIDEDGNKSFLSGGQKQGAYTIIGDFKQNQNGIVLAEGFATAASVHQATGKPVIVAFDAGNLKAVSEKLADVLPENIPVYFAADNDPSHTGEQKARAAAEVWGDRAEIILPEFTLHHVRQYQEEKGTDKVPTDFNDLHQLAGIDAVKKAFGIATEQEIRQPENIEPQEIRTAWNDFPPVISNGKLGDLKNEPEYPAAKAGDVVQSALLVEKLLKDETVQEIKNLIGDNQPILVPIQSEEASGKNRIPQATAFALAEKLGLQVDENIYQSNTAKRTDTGIYHRYVSPPEFKGEVQAGKSYLIVDDTLSVGGAIATLKGYIENNGGKVIGSTVMTAHALKVDIPIQPNMLQSLQQKQGLDEYWHNEFGYGLDKLTQQEAGHLRKPTLEQIQERVQEARQNLNLSENKELNHEQTTQAAETEQRPVHSAPEIDGRTIRGIETVRTGEREVSQSVFQQPQPPRNEEVSPPSQTAISKNDVAVSSLLQEQVMPEHDNWEAHIIHAVANGRIHVEIEQWQQVGDTEKLHETGDIIEQMNTLNPDSEFWQRHQDLAHQYGLYDEQIAAQHPKFEYNIEQSLDFISDALTVIADAQYEKQRQAGQAEREQTGRSVISLLTESYGWQKLDANTAEKVFSQQDGGIRLLAHFDMAGTRPDITLKTEQGDTRLTVYTEMYENKDYPAEITAEIFNRYADRYVSTKERSNIMEVMAEQQNLYRQQQQTPPISQPLQPTAASEQDVAVSISATDEPEQEMPNRIEYDGFQHEIRQPESPNVVKTPSTTAPETDEPEQEKGEPERAAPEQEKSQANTGLDYEIPEHLKSRMVAVDAQRFRLAGYEMGAHLLVY